MVSIFERYYQIVKADRRRYYRADRRYYRKHYDPAVKRWRRGTGQFTKAPKPRQKKLINPPVVRVTVGTGVSVEGRRGKPSRFSFTWQKVVLRSEAAQAVADGTAWIRDHAFGVACRRLGFSSKYGEEWGLDEMDNFPGFNVEDDAPADFTEFGREIKSVRYNGSEVDV
jgi:hypothetical protein